MECKYHKLVGRLDVVISERILSRYDWIMFDLWLGDESNLRTRYIDTFEEILEIELTEEQKILVGKKGDNLENAIAKWRKKFKNDHPTLNENLPILCAFAKISEYIINQLRKPDLRSIINDYC